MRVARERGRAGMRVPVELVVARADAPGRMAGERVERRLPELRPAAAAGCEQAPLPRHRGLAGVSLVKSCRRAAGIGGDDAHESATARAANPARRTRPRDLDRGEPLVEQPADPPRAAAASASVRSATSRPWVPGCSCRGRGPGRSCACQHTAGTAAARPRTAPAPRRVRAGPSATSAAIPSTDGERTAARRGEVERERARHDQTHRCGADAPAIGLRAEPGQEHDGHGDARRQGVPVADRIAQAAARAERDQGRLPAAEEAGVRAGWPARPASQDGPARSPEPGPRPDRRQDEDDRQQQARVGGREQRGGERAPRVVRPRHRESESTASPPKQATAPAASGDTSAPGQARRAMPAATIAQTTIAPQATRWSSSRPDRAR